MSTYEILKDIDVDKLTRLGFLKQTVRRNMAIYESYLDYLERGASKTNAVTWVADHNKCSESHVWTVIKRFSEI